MTTLDESYARCRQISRSLGASYSAITLLLPRVKRHHVHALCAFWRHVDDVLAELGPIPIPEREQALTGFGERFLSDLDRGDSEDPVLKAVVHTVIAFDVNPDCFRRFLRSRHTNLAVVEYETFDDLLDYMDGSAAAIGESLLPILEPTSGDAIAPARDLAIGIQLVRFLRDVSRDLDRGRVYLPQEDLHRYGADPWLRRVTPEWAELMTFEIARARERLASGERVLDLLPAASARCIRAARALSSGTLDQIESSDGDVFAPSSRASRARRAIAMGRGLVGR
jgi:phytoene synthase